MRRLPFYLLLPNLSYERRRSVAKHGLSTNLRSLALGLALASWAAGAEARSCPAGSFENFPAGDATAATFDPAMLADAIRDLRRSDRDIRSLLVIKDCTLVVELYKEGSGRDYLHSMHSVTKSFVVTLAGVLVGAGKLSLDAPLSTALDRPRGIADATWARAGKVNLRHVFGMLSGYEYVHTPSAHALYTAMDRLQIALLPGTEAPPGIRFNYSDADAVMAGASLAKAAGRDLLGFATDALFKPLAFREVEWWWRDHAGRYPGGWGLRMRPMDAAKLGQLYLQRGSWNGREIIPPGFVDEVWRAGPNPRYGLFWWRTSSDNGFYAWGWKGQRVFVFPEFAMVIVITANIDEDSSVLHPAVRKILSALREGRSNAAPPLAAEALRRELGEPFKGGIPGPAPVPEDSLRKL
jgi:CubicO group peptidase (beta-lactamase class C family)